MFRLARCAMSLSGHGGTGKTTLVEEMLAAGGVIPKAERVETGKTVSDFTEEEISRKISVHTSAQPPHLEGLQDQHPRHPRVSGLRGGSGGRVSRGRLRAVVGADVGVQIETIKLWRRLSRNGKPRFHLHQQDGEGARGFRRERRRPVGEVQGQFRARGHPPGRGRLQRVSWTSSIRRHGSRARKPAIRTRRRQASRPHARSCGKRR